MQSEIENGYDYMNGGNQDDIIHGEIGRDTLRNTDYTYNASDFVGF